MNLPDSNKTEAAVEAELSIACRTRPEQRLGRTQVTQSCRVVVDRAPRPEEKPKPRVHRSRALGVPHLLMERDRLLEVGRTLGIVFEAHGLHELSETLNEANPDRLLDAVTFHQLQRRFPVKLGLRVGECTLSHLTRLD